jgi:hypothetical protein
VIAATDTHATIEELLYAALSVWSVPRLYNIGIGKACTDGGLACSAKGRIFNNMLYVRNIDLRKGQEYS